MIRPPPVFTAAPGQPTRIHLLNGASTDRDSTFILHGHVWQRDPFVCPGQSDLGLVGRCNPNEPVPSQALGNNPQGKYVASQEGMGHNYGHWPILIRAGGTDAVPGDYLFRDYSPSGNTAGCGASCGCSKAATRRRAGTPAVTNSGRSSREALRRFFFWPSVRRL